MSDRNTVFGGDLSVEQIAEIKAKAKASLVASANASKNTSKQSKTKAVTARAKLDALIANWEDPKNDRVTHIVIGRLRSFFFTIGEKPSDDQILDLVEGEDWLSLIRAEKVLTGAYLKVMEPHVVRLDASVPTPPAPVKTKRDAIVEKIRVATANGQNTDSLVKELIENTE